MEIFKILSVLLCYPEKELIDDLSDIRLHLATSVEQNKWDIQLLEPLLEKLATEDLITLQENYVQTFDRNPRMSLHLFEHIYGEDRMRGSALVELLEEYREAGVDLQASDELPDFLPLFLEFLSLCEEKQAFDLLSASIDVVATIGKKLKSEESVYAGIFDLLVEISPTAPVPLITPPVRDMDEAMAKFGPNSEGLEPLLQPNAVCATCSSNTLDKNRGIENALPR